MAAISVKPSPPIRTMQGGLRLQSTRVLASASWLLSTSWMGSDTWGKTFVISAMEILGLLVMSLGAAGAAAGLDELLEAAGAAAGLDELLEVRDLFATLSVAREKCLHANLSRSTNSHLELWLHFSRSTNQQPFKVMAKLPWHRFIYDLHLVLVTRPSRQIRSGR